MTEFAVEVYDAVTPVDHYILAYSVAASVSAVSGVLLASYFYFSMSIYPIVKSQAQ